MTVQHVLRDHSEITEEDNKIRYEEKKNYFEGKSHIAAINAFGVKTLLINDYYNEELFTDERVWNTFNQIFTHCKSLLLDEVKAKLLSKYEHVSDDIRVDYCVYIELHSEEPYEEILEDTIERGMPIYIPSDDPIETHLYEAYYYAHKMFYDRRYKVNRTKHFEKY